MITATWISFAYGNVPALGHRNLENASQEFLRIVCGWLAESVAMKEGTFKWNKIKERRRELNRAKREQKCTTRQVSKKEPKGSKMEQRRSQIATEMHKKRSSNKVMKKITKTQTILYIWSHFGSKSYQTLINKVDAENDVEKTCKDDTKMNQNGFTMEQKQIDKLIANWQNKQNEDRKMFQNRFGEYRSAQQIQENHDAVMPKECFFIDCCTYSVFEVVMTTKVVSLKDWQPLLATSRARFLISSKSKMAPKPIGGSKIGTGTF